MQFFMRRAFLKVNRNFKQKGFVYLINSFFPRRAIYDAKLENKELYKFAKEMEESSFFYFD